MLILITEMPLGNNFSGLALLLTLQVFTPLANMTKLGTSASPLPGGVSWSISSELHSCCCVACGNEGFASVLIAYLHIENGPSSECTCIVCTVVKTIYTISDTF